MAIFNRAKKKKGSGLSPVTAGAIAAVIIVVAVFFAFSAYNPFHRPYTFTATFKSANNLKQKSPVRIAGVEVGMVKKVEPLPEGNGAAKVTMTIEKVGLPIHKDAQLKIRPRIFLEGNFFVDISPGTPQAGTLEKDGNIPINQTDTPVQFGEILTALQSDTREDLKDFLREYGQNALGNGQPPGKSDEPTGADYYNQSLDDGPEALKNASIANDATLGQRPGDLQRVIKQQQKVFAALSTHPENLKDLVTNLNVTARALSADEGALADLAPTLRDTVIQGRPALASLDAALPTLRAFARDALPGVRSSEATLRESRPFIRQLRGLVSEDELKGLTRDLRPTIPALARVNRSTIGLLDENRALSACQNQVLLPFARTPIPDPDFPANSGQPFYKQGPRGFVGLAGESRIFDANSPLFHINFGTGPTTIVYGDRGESFFAQAPEAPAGIRPIRPNSRPQFRPDVPCETQEPPDLNAPGGRPDRSFTPGPGSLIPGVVCNIIGGELIPCPTAKNRAIYEKGQVQLNQVTDFFKRKKAGKVTPDPLTLTPPIYLKELDKMGLESTKKGNIREKRSGPAKPETTSAEDSP
jgi:phospholipid/cholesterol/gamma-HCH transport system substrate-binding protein